ncbi:MAG: sugar ABC transporter substrate-binding protein [Microbacterium sp.]|uniref:sugar ABC transporter substrate-binding protein n=1 Tax=Microbacterium sp. TaxID=51671 RepID=UPI0039E3073D
MNKWTRAAGVAAAAMLALSTAACANTGGSEGGEGGESKGAIAWSFASQDVAIWASQLSLMKPAIEEAGYEFLTNDPAFDLQTQVNDMQAWIARGDVKAMGGFPVDPSSMVPITAEAKAAGIPMIAYAVSWEGAVAMTVAPNVEAGTAVGDAAGKWISENYGSDEVSVAILADTQTQLGQDQLKGMTEGLEASGAKVKIYPLEATTRDVGYSVAQSQLTADPNTKVWLGIGADMTLGARQAVIDSGVAADDEGYYVSATDANKEVLGLIETGTDMWRTSFAWRAEDLAEANVKLLLAAAAGETPEDIVVDVKQVLPDNVGDFANNG